MNFDLGRWQISLSESVLQTLYKLSRKQSNNKENGGILIGQVSKDVVKKVIKENIHITDVSVPGNTDVSKPFSFVRNPVRANIIIQYFFKNSQGTKIYLGEWHSHPESIPSPSHQDIRMIKHQFKTNILNRNYILFLIAGWESFYFGVYDGKKILKTNVSLKDLKK